MSGLLRTGACLKPAGALSSKDLSYSLARMQAWGHTKEQVPHWMHSFSSQIGTESETLRFSHRVVAEGKVPSIGILETGSESPSPTMMVAMTSLTNSGACGETVGGISMVEVTALYGISYRLARVSSTALKFCWTISSPLRP
ncbi:MAG: hypothetical protein BWX54_01655 [Verrucomicrobia bacterium ADurb.Bin018]|nr:MAG: hypothetical protein BWX54_01655 [Verrucomicrobia bacterium ADurb.Bin018]